MYHGYTLINASIDGYCPKLKETIKDDRLNSFDRIPNEYSFLSKENLTGTSGSGSSEEGTLTPEQKRKFISERLDIDKNAVFRNIRKNKKLFLPYLILTTVLPLLLILSISPLREFFFYTQTTGAGPGNYVVDTIVKRVVEAVPFVGKTLAERYLGGFVLIADLITLAALIYFFLFLYWFINRRIVLKMYISDFAKVSPSDIKVPYNIEQKSWRWWFFGKE